MSRLTVYTYKNCDTCRKAVKWLKARGLSFAEKPIRETPPSTGELRAMLAAYGGERRKLFNTSGQDYRALQLGEKLDGLSDPEALKLLQGNGNLVKRPFLIGEDVARVGFDEKEWAAALAG